MCSSDLLPIPREVVKKLSRRIYAAHAVSSDYILSGGYGPHMLACSTGLIIHSQFSLEFVTVSERLSIFYFKEISVPLNPIPPTLT